MMNRTFGELLEGVTPFSDFEREVFIRSTLSFERCPYTRGELQAMSDDDLSAAGRHAYELQSGIQPPK